MHSSKNKHFDEPKFPKKDVLKSTLKATNKHEHYKAVREMDAKHDRVDKKKAADVLKRTLDRKSSVLEE